MAGYILITEPVDASLRENLEAIGYTVAYQPGISREALMSQIPEATGLIIRSFTKVDEGLLDQAKQLRFVARAGAGLEHLDHDLLHKYGVKVLHAAEGNKDALAEQTVALIIMMLRNLWKACKELKNGEWVRKDNCGRELGAQTAGIIGYGNMGAAVAERLKCLGCRVMVYDKYQSGYGKEGIEEAGLQDIFDEASVVSLHLPLTEETQSLVDRTWINNFFKPIWFVNTSRGAIVDHGALIEGLENGKINGAALDVLENENLKTLSRDQEKRFNQLAEDDRVIMTPHLGGITYEASKKIGEVLVEKIRKMDSV